MSHTEGSETALFTIGHSNHPIERFIGLLTDVEIRLVIDVRSHPGSRFNPQFNRGRLESTLQECGIEYLWMGQHLGGRDGTSVASPEFQAEMGKVIRLSRNQNVAVMCSEGKPQDCHRTTKLTAWLHRERQPVKASHIVPAANNGAELVNTADFEAGLPPKRLWFELDERGQYGRE